MTPDLMPIGGLGSKMRQGMRALQAAAVALVLGSLAGPAVAARVPKSVCSRLLLPGLTSQAFVLVVPLRGLPFRINVTSVTDGTGGLNATGTAEHVTLGS